MLKNASKLIFVWVLLWIFPPASQATGNHECRDDLRPVISFVEFQSLDIGQKPPSPLTVKGKLKLPVGFDRQQLCYLPKRNLSAVVILHGSSGVDSRGDFYARALNVVGIATLEIDMWEARGVTGGEGRPQLPILTYPDAFSALALLSTHDNIDPDRIGVLGFSWGGVITMASAEQLYSKQFGGDQRFAAHVAHYPVCYGYNNPNIPPLNPPDERGTQFLDLTGAPLLIQIGTEDDYDNGAHNCLALIDDLRHADDQSVVEIVAYEGAYHAWDRLQVPITVFDPFADEGSVFSTGVVPTVEIVPDVGQAYASRKKAIQFFLRNL